MRFIDDEPVNLHEIDLLGNLKYSEQLKEDILNYPNNKSITIGLFGAWGSGKSSIVETTRIDLEFEIKFITYDAWKYTNDGFRRTFLSQIRDELNSIKIKPKYLAKRLYANVSRSKYEWGFRLLITLVIASILIFETLNQFHDIAIVAVILLVLEWAFKMLLTSNTNIQTPHYFSPEQFENDFKIMIDEFTEGNSKKIVIVIDNIDRCTQEQAYQTLTDVKCFLDNKNCPVIFLIPVDDIALENKIQEHGDNPSEFFRKIFDTVIHIKPSKEMYDFVNIINEKERLELKSDTMYIIADECSTNPRRIIKILNNLKEELALFNIQYPDNNFNFTKEYETLICKLLIIKEEWPEFYSDISQTPNLLKTKTDMPTDFRTQVNIQEEPEKQKTEKELMTFLKNTKAITKNIDNELIQKLTRNHDSFKGLPDTIYTSLIEKNYEEIFGYINSDQNFSLLCDYLIYELKKGKQRGAYETKVPETFDHIIMIHNHKSIEDYNSKIENLIWEPETLLSFIASLDELKCLVKYTYDLKEKFGRNYLYDIINNILNLMSPYYVPEGFYKDLFLTFVNEYPDEDLCKNVQRGFVQEYERVLGFDYLLESGDKIRLEKVNNLISGDFFNLLISKEASISPDVLLSNLEYIISTDAANGRIKIETVKSGIESLRKSYFSVPNYGPGRDEKAKKFNNFINCIRKYIDF